MVTTDSLRPATEAKAVPSEVCSTPCGPPYSHRGFSSGALLRGDGGKRGPALLDVLAAGVRTGDLFLLMSNNGQNLRKGFLAAVAEVLVVAQGVLATAETDAKDASTSGARAHDE